MLLANSLRVLCFGDSLTAGHTQGGSLFHPYGIALKASLEKSLPSWDISTDIQGLGGDQAVSPPGVFFPRMDKLYTEVHPKSPYDWAIVLGGTNDLNQDRLPSDIFPALERVWAIPLSNNTKVLALTVTGCGACAPVIPERRADLNQRILGHRASNYYTYDLHKAVPYWGMSEERRREIWDDTLHFTVKGYDLVGKLLADRIVELVKQEERESPEEGLIREELRKRRTRKGGRITVQERREREDGERQVEL
ncbi:SGNH hydrolase-type esterase domain-containing protein [Rhexocercosporidium sp. MPI-PUGE-AT-0058]|nr:SGNH hydrolase-type esterase domain-containing protein [Rhexocercosporidium sp. MPI-PUGE-AT-0058]